MELVVVVLLIMVWETMKMVVVVERLWKDLFRTFTWSHCAGQNSTVGSVLSSLSCVMLCRLFVCWLLA